MKMNIRGVLLSARLIRILEGRGWILDDRTYHSASLHHPQRGHALLIWFYSDCSIYRLFLNSNSEDVCFTFPTIQ